MFRKRRKLKYVQKEEKAKICLERGESENVFRKRRKRKRVQKEEKAKKGIIRKLRKNKLERKTQNQSQRKTQKELNLVSLHNAHGTILITSNQKDKLRLKGGGGKLDPLPPPPTRRDKDKNSVISKLLIII